jgi:homoserine dehydrogenase
MKDYNVCFLGFGNVGRALARLLALKSTELKELFGIQCRITGVATRRLGWLSRQSGFDFGELTSSTLQLANVHRSNSVTEWLNSSEPDVVFETTSLNHETGQPSIDYLRAALMAGAHAITANKGAVVYGYDELSSLAQAAGKRFFFESTVADSAPVFSLFRESLPGVNLRGLSAALSSTCNIVIETMEAGRTFEEGIKTAQELGVAETDPSHDVDGWDSTVKVCALARVLMGCPLYPAEVRREGIRGLTSPLVQKARADGKPYKLLARVHRGPDGSINATVRPEQVSPAEPFGIVRGTSLAVHFELDVMPGLTIMSHRPNLQSTAYGLLADFINAVRRDTTK